MNHPVTPSEQTPPPPDGDSLERTEQAAAELRVKLSLGLPGKRETASWEEFEERAIQLFRDQGLCKNKRPV